MMDKSITKIIRDFGRPVTIVPPEMATQETKAFIQPLRYKDNSYLGGEYVNIGKVNTASFLYIGNRDIRLDLYPSNTIVQTDEESYVVKKAQKVCFKNDIVYIWAILQTCSEEEYV